MQLDIGSEPTLQFAHATSITLDIHLYKVDHHVDGSNSVVLALSYIKHILHRILQCMVAYNKKNTKKSTCWLEKIFLECSQYFSQMRPTTYHAVVKFQTGS